MDTKGKELILYGLENYKEVISKIISELGIFSYEFDIRLILTEALTNAFNHGNESDKSKPIYLEYYYDGKSVTFEIKDSGSKAKVICIPEKISDEDLLNDHGRGLFLIKCLADEFYLRDNAIIIKKNIEKGA